MTEAPIKSFVSRFSLSPAGRAFLALVFVLLIGVAFNADGAFFKLGTHRDTLRQSSVYGILACGMTLVIISGGIDLAVGSILALVAVCASLMSISWGLSPWVVVPASVLVGGACGVLSGTVITKLNVQPFIATLAMMVFARGLAKHVSGGMKISTAIQNADGSYRYVEVPKLFRMIDARVIGDHISVVTLIFAACALLAYLLLSRHVWGRQLCAIGGNEDAARLSGVPVTAAKIAAYAASGVFAAIAGVCQVAQEQQGDPEAGAGYELVAIAMVVIGGTSLMGGRGGMGLTLLGVLTIGYLEKILSINAVPEATRLMLTGIIVVAAVVAQRGRQT
jgi:ribose transport system permease protein